MNKKQLVSVITVTYNSESTVIDTIEGVLNQSYPNIEYIIVDGNSSDETLNIIKSYEEKFKNRGYTYKWISERDRGIYDAYNKGVKLASGNIIGIINSDDWYNEEAVTEIEKVFNDKSKVIVAGEKRKVTFDKQHYGIYYNKKNVKKNINKVMPLNFPATFIHKSVYNEIGFFDTKYRLSADYDLVFRAFNAGVDFMFTDEIIVNMRNSGATGQLNSLWITAKEDQHIRKKNKVKLTNWYYFKRIIFNCLVIARDSVRNIINKK
ncbi:glycosyltransferase [Tenacibaculum sp. 190524A02b]|uniref:Glycosyltransferase n=1 Tax=Tenacibaculum vairaonense TaxID=3137860 RepID=A0ABP1FB91_9FLAO